MADLPDWYSSVVLKGLYGTELKTVAVDELGRLFAVLKALYGVTPKDVQCDLSGNLTLNLKAQDLAELINRPKYGAARRLNGGVACNPTDWTTLFTLSGKGIVYGGWVLCGGANADPLSTIRYSIDDKIFVIMNYYNLFRLGLTAPFKYPLFVTTYDLTNLLYLSGFSPEITFESSVKVEFVSAGGIMTIQYEFHYALV